jgi:hypothetical protein
MPAPQASAMQQFARLKFTSFALKVPTNFQDPSGDPAASQYGQSMKDSEKTTAPGAPPLFQPSTMSKNSTDTQKMHIDKIGSFIDKSCSAICSAWSTWQSAATMTGVLINGPVASLGVVVGPPWTPLILAQGAVSTPMEMKYTKVIAAVIGTAWLQYTATIKIPGLPWYPLYAAFPGPMAAPTPNIPASLMMLTQVAAGLSADALKGQMIGQLGDPTAPFNKELFEAIATGFYQCFQIWQAATMVTNVMPLVCPVPTFAPPYVPVGPVVGGTAAMLPSGLV